MAGPVFAKIAARVYSKNVTGDISKVADSLSVFVPDVKNGDIAAAGYVLDELGIGDANITNIRRNIIAKVARKAVRGGEANYVSQICKKYLT